MAEHTWEILTEVLIFEPTEEGSDSPLPFLPAKIPLPVISFSFESEQSFLTRDRTCYQNIRNYIGLITHHQQNQDLL